MITFNDTRAIFVLAPSHHIYSTLTTRLRSIDSEGRFLARRGAWICTPGGVEMARGLEKFNVIQATSPRPFIEAANRYDDAVEQLALQFRIMAGRPGSMGNMWIRVVLP